MSIPQNADFFEVRLPASETKVHVGVLRSARARGMLLRIKNDGNVCVVVPAKARGNVLEKAEMFTLKNLDWLDAHLKKVTRVVEDSPKSLLEYLREQPRIFVGEKAQLVEIETVPVRPFFVFREASEVLPICVRAESAESDLVAQIRGIAALVLPPRILELAERCGVSVGKISIRNQHSRWGSCTSKGDLSMNWRLVLLPPEIRDHVILHELAHRRYMNHSDDFWDLLYRWDPQTREHDRLLTKTWSKIISRF